MRPGQFVFATVEGKPLHPSNVRRVLEQTKTAAGLADLPDRLSMHALRHSFLSFAATELDVPDTTLARMAGHANAAVTMRLYARDERNQDAVNADVLGRAAAAGFGA